SPSYPLLASLDLARRYLVEYGREQISLTIKRLEDRRIKLESELTRLTIWEGNEHVNQHDPLKWIVSCRTGFVTGYELLDLFYCEHCTAEISDPRNIVFIFSIHENEEDIEKVVQAIKRVDAYLQKNEPISKESNQEMVLFADEGTVYQPQITLQEAFHREHKQVKLSEAVGLLCGETVLPYPPGIPLLTPGEDRKSVV